MKEFEKEYLEKARRTLSGDDVLAHMVIGLSTEAMNDNIIKLSKRYPDKFEDVVVRDLDIELNHIKG